MICLNLNESPFDLVTEIKDEIANRIRGLSFNRYPDREALEESLAKLYGVCQDNLVVGNGSDEIIQLLALTFGRTGKCVTMTPTFSMYEKCIKSVGGDLVKVPLNSDFSLNISGMIEECREASLVFLCNPNNPTGNTFSVQDLKLIAKSTKGIVVIDEAYAEYYSESALSFIAEYSNLCVLRTFSKAWSLAGIRLGVAIGAPELVNQINNLRLPYNLNSLTITTLQVMLEIMGTRVPKAEHIASERSRVFTRLEGISGITPFPSAANFLLFRTEGSALTAWERLRARGILVRRFDEDELRNYLRVSIGLPKHNDLFLKALEECL